MLGYDPVKDFAPVSMLGSSPFVLSRPDPGLPRRTCRNSIALAKAKPGTLSYASAGPATLAHLAGALFEKMAEVEMVHVPYRGSAQSTIDLMRGPHRHRSSAPSRRRWRISAKASCARSRSPATSRNAALPEVPTIAEAGLPGYESALWQGFVMPAATPPAIIARLNREVTAALNDPGVRAALTKQGVEPEPGPPELFAQRIRTDLAKWRDVIVSAGIHE